MESGRHYTPDDLELAEGIAARAALALDNARLYGNAETARAEAEDANRAKDQFLSVVSHELKTPLAAALGWLHVLRQGRHDLATRALETIERSMKLQSQLIDELLDISRVVTGRLRLDPRPVDFSRIVEVAIEMIRPEAAANGVRLEVNVDRLPGPIFGDPNRVQQIVSNLLGNAVKFTPADGSVSVRLEPVQGRAQLVVRDTGKGISKEFLPHVFEQFRQAEPVTTRDKRGLGLGLAITRHLVELHGGTIAVSSEGEGKGATFTVALPMSPYAASSPPAAQARAV
jgi:signal transduction histidine kinase